jgi:hypothetical protein
VTGLDERLARLEDRLAVTDVLHRYAWTIDHGPDAEWLDCFTDGAVVEIRYRQGADLARLNKGVATPTGVRHTGKEQLAAFKAAHSRSPDQWHKHVVADIQIAIDGTSATAGSYLVRVDETAGALHVRAFGRYRDRLTKSADGQWRFVERIVEIEAIDRAGPGRG